MAIQFRPTRTEVTRAFPVLGFTIRTGAAATSCEIALATEASLLRAAGKDRRTPTTFWSTRSRGRVDAPRGESVFVVPPEVLARFAGQERLYYGIAAFRESEPASPEIQLPPENAAPFVILSRSYTGQSRRLGTGARGREPSGYGSAASPDLLTWAADEAAPGSLEPVTVGAPAHAGSEAAAGFPPAPAGPSPVTQGLGYSDGLGDAFWEQLAAEVEVGDEREVGPIPDSAEDAGEQPVVQGLDAPTPEDPCASRFVPANTGNYRVATGRTVRRIVIHITDGGSRISGTIGWFQNPESRVSAHYVIGQDGEIVQMVRHADVAWHAGSANRDSIGIEHVANTRGLVPTQAQYEASARLVAWLCGHHQVPVDRDHVLGHAEADQRTTHRACPNAVWDWDTYMGLVRGHVGTTAGQVAQALEGSMDLYYDDVQLVAQPTDSSCWAAAVTMVYGWTKRISLDPRTIAMECHRIQQLGTGLPRGERDDLARELGLSYEAPVCYTVQGFFDLLSNNGPLYVGRSLDESGHAVCVVGIHGDGTPEGTTIIFNDPWPPGQGVKDSRLGFVQFMQEYEANATGDATTPAYPQIIHGNMRRQSASLALGLGGMYTNQPGQPYAQPYGQPYAQPYQPTGGYAQAYGHNGGGHAQQYGGTATLVHATDNGAGDGGGGAGVGVAVAEGVVQAIAGAVVGNTSGITWNLPSYPGPHHPGGNRQKAGTGPYLRVGPIPIRGPRQGTFGGADQIFADFDIEWEQNGRSIGSISINPTPNAQNDAAGASLDVRATITPMLEEVPGPASNPTRTVAGVRVQFQYAFSYSWASDSSATADVELHGDGTYTVVNHF